MQRWKSLWIKNLTIFKQCNELNWKSRLSRWRVRLKEEKKKKNAKISVRVCEETAQVGKKKLPENIVN